MQPWCRFPRGKRGLKSANGGGDPEPCGSLPPREAWIEINDKFQQVVEPCVASPAGSVD